MATLHLSQGKVAVVDDDDYEWLNQWKWTYKSAGKGYAYRFSRSNGVKTHVLMHRLIMNAPPNTEVDHINSDGLDNKRANLRIVTKQQNSWNKLPLPSEGGYKGIYRSGKGWAASLIFNGDKIYIGIFESPESAAHAYDAYAQYYFGGYAWCNFTEWEANVSWLL